MSKQVINVGSAPNDGTGDTLRTGMTKVNTMMDDIFNTGQIVFVDGSSVNGNGSAANPFQTIGEAYAYCETQTPASDKRFCISITPGTYSASGVIRKPYVSLKNPCTLGDVQITGNLSGGVIDGETLVENMESIVFLEGYVFGVQGQTSHLSMNSRDNAYVRGVFMIGLAADGSFISFISDSFLGESTYSIGGVTEFSSCLFAVGLNCMTISGLSADIKFLNVVMPEKNQMVPLEDNTLVLGAFPGTTVNYRFIDSEIHCKVWFNPLSADAPPSGTVNLYVDDVSWRNIVNGSGQADIESIPNVNVIHTGSHRMGYGSMEYNGIPVAQTSSVDGNGDSDGWQSMTFITADCSYRETHSVSMSKGAFPAATITEAGAYNLRIYFDVLPGGAFPPDINSAAAVAIFQSGLDNGNTPWSAVASYSKGWFEDAGTGALLIDANLLITEADLPVTIEPKWRANSEMLLAGIAPHVLCEAMVFQIRQQPDTEKITES